MEIIVIIVLVFTIGFLCGGLFTVTYLGSRKDK